MHAAFLISAKDLRQRLRDRSAFMWGFIVPFGLAALFSQVFDFGTGGVHFTYAVVNQDAGPLGTAFVDQVLGGLETQDVASVTEIDNVATAREKTADGTVDATFVIPPAFSSDVTSGKATSLEVIGNADASIATQVADALAQRYGQSLTATQVAVGLVASATGTSDPASLASLGEQAAHLDPAITLTQVATADKQLSSTTYLMAGMAVFFLFFTVQFGVTGLLEERRLGTLQRLLAAPISRFSVIGGKILTSFALGVVSMSVLIVASALLLGATWGNPVGVGILVVAGVISAVGIMAVIATFARTAEQANVWQSITAVVLGMLGGSFFPIAQGQSWFAKLSLITPHQWFLRALGDLAGGGGPVEVLPAAGIMCLFGVVGFAIAGWRMRTTEMLR